MDILRVEHLSKRFGSHQVIADLSLTVPEHSVMGFLGQNGAGKTTTMKLILGLLKADSGSVSVCDEPVAYGQTKTNRYIGYLPDVPEFYAFMRPLEYLRLCGDITGLDSKKTRLKSEELLALVGLDGVNRRIGGFSRGMKQRLGIAQALLNEPRLLVCDEPTSALDPLGRKEILDILRQVKGKTTVLFSTHILSDAERICDRVSVLHHGRLVLSGMLDEIKAQHREDSLLVEFRSGSDVEKFMRSPLMADLRACAKQTGGSVVITSFDISAAEAAVIAALKSERLLPVKLEMIEPTLEGLFLEAVK